MTQGDYQVIIILQIKSKMAAARKKCSLQFRTELSLHLCHPKSAIYKCL